MSSLAHPKRSPLRLNRFVFLSSSVSIGILGLLTVLYPEGSEHWLQWAQAEVSAAFGWWYMLLIVLCLGFVLWLAFSPYGRIRLGHNEESPAFGYVAWVSSCSRPASASRCCTTAPTSRWIISSIRPGSPAAPWPPAARRWC